MLNLTIHQATMQSKLLLILAFTITSFQLSAQEIRMDNITYQRCQGLFTDSQGSTSNYLPGETYTTTICSFFSTDQMRLDFLNFDLAPGDLLAVYDGDSSRSPFIASFDSLLSPTVIQSSSTNTSACLTFVFTSVSSSPGAAGWVADISCVDDCQTITSTVVTTPTPDFDGVLRICQGETVDFAGTASFSTSGVGATMEFILPDGSTVNNSNTSFTFNNSGIYKVDFVVTATNGCRDRTIDDVVILVSTTPDFTGTNAAQDIICLGDSTVLTGAASVTGITPNVDTFVTGTHFLPDGDGNTYRSCIDVRGLPGGLIFQNASDLEYVSINIEHSYTGDLDIVLKAPNGTTIDLFRQAGDGSYFGLPIDDNTDLRPGIGYTYNFTERTTALQTLAAVATATGSNMSVPEGDYLPEDPFANLIGSPLNGTWCLEITDNIPSDNGYIFEWGFVVAPELIVIAPDVLSESWQSNADIINTSSNGTVITVQPTTAGEHCYNYELMDNFGCIYIETVCIDVFDPASIPSSLPDYGICADISAMVTIDLSSNEQNIVTSSGLDVVNYYASQSDAISGINPLSNIVTLDPGITFITIFVKLGGNLSCEVIRPYNITKTVADIGDPVDLEVVDFNGDMQETFDLTTNNFNLLGILSSFDHGFAYYENESDARSGINNITNPMSYVINSSPQIIYGRLFSLDGNCSAYRPFTISFTNQAELDSDGDGVFNNQEDLNNNGDLTDDDTDNDQIPNYLDTDDDGDTVPTAIEIIGTGAGTTTNSYTYIDTDNDLTENYLDDDDDGDGLDTIDEDYNLDGNPLNDDTNNNQIPDFLDDTVTLSVSTIENSGVEIYPTMVDDRITIKFNGSTLQNLQVTIVDLAGKQIISNSIIKLKI